jgi:hypothetical protein
MPASSGVLFADPQTVADLRTFTARARANDDGGMRLVAAGQVLAGYVSVLRPAVLGEGVPTVLGLRTMALAREADVDVTVSLGSVLDRLARMQGVDVEFSLPTTSVIETWAGILPPRTGWTPVGTVGCDRLEQSAREGVAAVARSLPERPGAPLVSSARTAVWGAPLDGVPGRVPAGAAFGAFSLGFLEPGTEATIHTHGRWSRLSSPRGHVLVKAASVF